MADRQIPAVAFIESALDALAARPAADVAAAAKEFDALGLGRLADLTRTRPHLRRLTPEQLGYLIGLETARTLDAMRPSGDQP